TELHTLSLHDALPILALLLPSIHLFLTPALRYHRFLQNASYELVQVTLSPRNVSHAQSFAPNTIRVNVQLQTSNHLKLVHKPFRSEEHTSELQSRENL